MKHKILLVTDADKQLTQSVQSMLCSIYDCKLATSIAKGIKLLSTTSHYCAILTTCHSKEVLTLFEHAQDTTPITNRILIADNIELNIVIKAVNKAKIFGLLEQPINTAELKELLSSAVLEYEKNQRIQLDTLTDPLTGLYNRRYIDRELGRVYEAARRHKYGFGIIFGDVNSFKRINDTYGHTLGDLLLKSIGHVLSQTCRGSDQICRYGGDEFIILIEQATKAQTERLVERLIKAMEKLNIPEMENEKFSLSLGHAVFPTNGETPDKILEEADRRMYEAKKHKPR